MRKTIWQVNGMFKVFWTLCFIYIYQLKLAQTNNIAPKDMNQVDNYQLIYTLEIPFRGGKLGKLYFQQQIQSGHNEIKEQLIFRLLMKPPCNLLHCAASRMARNSAYRSRKH